MMAVRLTKVDRKTGRVYFFDQSWRIFKAMQRLINDEPHNLFELPHFDENVKNIQNWFKL